MSEKYDEYEDNFDDVEGEEYGDAFDVDSAGDDENWDDSDVDQPYAEQPKKKKSSFSTVLIVVLAVVGALGFVAYKFGGSSSVSGTSSDVASTASPTTMPESVNPTSDTPDVALVPAPVNEQTGDAGDMTQPSEIAEQAATQPQPDSLMTTLPGEVPQQPVQDAPQGASTDAGQAIPSLQPVSDFPSVNDIKKSDVVEAQPLENEPAPAMEVPAPQAEIITTPQATPDLTGSQPAVVDMTPDAVVSEQPPAEAVQPEAQIQKAESAQVVDVQDTALQQAQVRISELEKTVAEGERLQMESSKQLSDMKDRISSLEAELARAQERPVPVYSSAEQKPVKSSAPKIVSKKSVVEAGSSKAPAQSPKWVLKSARAGQAVLGQVGKTDLKTVSVGERVDGLGTILSIDHGQNGWIVVGTLNRLGE